MSELVRLSLSIEKPLHRQLEKMVSESGYSNRSEFIRDMIRNNLVRRRWKKNDQVIGTITLVFDHNVRNLSRKLTSVQHHHHDEILATTHVHLTEDICAEMILVKGKAGHVNEIADSLKQQKGVLHGELSMSSMGDELR